MGVVPIQAGQGSHLCTVSFYRMADGTTRAALEDMPAHVIEGEETIPARFARAAVWCHEGARDLLRQGAAFVEVEPTTQGSDSDA